MSATTRMDVALLALRDGYITFPNNLGIATTSNANTVTLSADATDDMYITDSGGTQCKILTDCNFSGATFGSQYTYAESEAASSTNSTSFINKLTLTTASVPAGNYYIGYGYTWRYSGTSRNFMGRVMLDGATTLDEHVQEPKDGGADQQQIVSKFREVALTAAVHTVEIDWASETGGNTATISRARIVLWRVS